MNNIDLHNHKKILFTRPYWSAVSAGQSDRVRVQVLKVLNINGGMEEKEQFLTACQENDYFSVRSLLSRGVDVNLRLDLDGWSALHYAAYKNYEHLLELLLAHTGVNVNMRSNHNDTPLMWACYAGHMNIARRLCQVTGIELNSRSIDGKTSLHHSVVRNKPACVSVLRGVAGVDWNVRSDDGWYPLTDAVSRGHAECLQIILTVPEPHLDLTVTDSRDRNIAQIAVEEDGGDRQKCVELLSGDRRVDWNIKNSDGETPVMFCLKNNKIEMSRCLINTPGVDLDAEDNDGRHLEDIARDRSLTEILDLLWTFRTVQPRMILRDSLLTRQAGSVASLQSLARDAIVLILFTNNSQERLVRDLVDRLELNITSQAREQLLASYSSFQNFTPRF